jgi:hypothetical protein
LLLGRSFRSIREGVVSRLRRLVLGGAAREVLDDSQVEPRVDSAVTDLDPEISDCRFRWDLAFDRGGPHGRRRRTGRKHAGTYGQSIHGDTLL